MKKMIIGIMIGLFLGISTNAFAAIGDTVQAVFAGFNYVVNGDSKTIDSPVLVYEGTSYVRTTDIANMLGFDVTYKADSRTIVFNQPEITPTPTSTTGGTPVPSPTPDSTSVPAQSPNPSATPVPTVSPSPTVTPTPTPTPPSNLAKCQAIRDNYNLQIGHIQSTKPNGWAWTITQLQNQMAAELTAAGCN